jgi:hypothetical protein
MYSSGLNFRLPPLKVRDLRLELEQQLPFFIRSQSVAGFGFLLLYNCVTILSTLNFDGVVESSIYCVAAVFQTLGILHVLPRL